MTVTCLICIFKGNSFQESGTNVAQRTLVDGTSSCLPSVSFPTRYKGGLWHTQLLCCYRKQLPHQVALVRSDTSRVSTWAVGIAVYHHVLQVFFFFFWGGVKPNTTLTKVYWEICLQWPAVVLHMGPTVETGGFFCACSTPQLPSIRPLQLIVFNTNALLCTNYIHP